ncbi:MAG: hypothetical protein NTY03_00935, partial [Candidatus Bathyarchaeota archaeon]|nr:hypothetical protein [Candidatus Bathyarchaeota archaeon]
MKINIPLMVQDPALTLKKSIIEGFEPTSERILLDGPTTDRLAVIDFDPDNGDLVKGATLVRPSKKKKEGYYVGDDSINLRKTKGKGIYSPPFMQVSTFATVLKTMYLFEGTGPERIETLGRPVKWAFNAPQLHVVPRAGVGANAYYHRDSHSLQFLIFKPDSKIIYTCLSRDIVAHETGHAIVDGIAPDLLDACTPHSLALHEAMADLTALLMAFNSNSLRTAVLAKTRGSLQNSTEFTSIAEEFGGAYLGRYLRNMKNRKTLNPDGGDERVDPLQPHDLSQVLSGALYDVLVKIHEKTKKDFAKEYSAEPQKNNSGYALYKTASWFKRMIFRALDYLPAGEVSFADYGRALIAVDKVAYPDNELWRDWIRDEFMNRWIVRDKAQLTVDNSYGDQHIDNVQEL